VQRDILNDAVALVEDAQHRDALRHRRHAAFPVRGRSDLAPGLRRLLLAASATGKRGRKQHYHSGVAQA